MSYLKPSAPWHYLFWSPPHMTGEMEVALARLTRRRGLPYMIGLFWGIVTDDGHYTLGCLTIFLSQNYPVFLCYAGYLLGFEDFQLIGIAWLATLAFGTVRHIGWLIWLLFRWPPLAKS